MTPTTEAPNLQIRPARHDDIPAVAALWCEAFPSRRTVAERARMLETGGRHGGLDTVLVAEDGSRLVGACKLYRLTQHITGRPLPMMGLAAVAVDPGSRRRGIGARLCTAAARAAHSRGDVVSVLYPFRPDYYARLGWGLVGRLHDHVFATDALPTYAEAAHVRPARLDRDLDAVVSCYARVAARSHGPIDRDARVWAYRLLGEEMAVRALDDDALRRAASDPARLVLVHDRAGIDGYALLRVRAGPMGGDAVLIRELVAESEAAYRGLLGAIAARADRWPRGRYRARPEERFEDRLREPRPPGQRSGASLYFRTARVMRGPMLRLLDVPAALRMRSWFDAVGDVEVDRALDVEVVDGLIPGNRGPWRVRFGAAGAVRVERPGSGRADATLNTDAATLARLFAGDLEVTEAVRLGMCRAAGDLDLADRALGVRETFWLPDEF